MTNHVNIAALSATRCVHGARVGVAEEGQEVVRVAPHVRRRATPQLLHAQFRLGIEHNSMRVLLSRLQTGGGLYSSSQTIIGVHLYLIPPHQLILDGAVHAVAIGGNLLDLKPAR